MRGSFHPHPFIFRQFLWPKPLSAPLFTYVDSGKGSKYGGVPVELVWINKHRFIARALRLGYNLLYMDTDTILFNDPYRFVKAPPLDRINLINLPESPCGMQVRVICEQGG